MYVSKHMYCNFTFRTMSKKCSPCVYSIGILYGLCVLAKTGNTI